MLLLENLFFFADRFCKTVVELSKTPEHEQGAATLYGWQIEKRSSIGNLHGAIQGSDLSGFIGATYQKYPFPSDPKQFKQNPDGTGTQAELQQLIEKFAKSKAIRLHWDRQTGNIGFGDFDFDEKGFAKLVAYMEQGGFPQWKDEVKPPYVQSMLDILNDLSSPLKLALK
ncbi:MAG: hypothetical protein V1754_11670 [Pseudomonadota bacterium]